MKHTITMTRIAFAVAAFASAPVFAQSNVTLYGIVDNGIGYQSSQAPTLGATSGGRSNTKMVQGVWAGSRFGLKGSEDLGGGTKAIFQLESGFNSATGGAQFTNALFGRQAWIGVTNNSYGTFQAGRQYTAYYTMLSPYSPTTWLTGFYGAHPGDLDALDTIYRASNSLVYTSPKWYGFTFSGSYSLGGVPGSFNSGSTWSGAAQYINGPVGIAVGIMRINNSTPGGGDWGTASTAGNNGQQVGVSAVTNGYRTAQAQQRFAVTGGYNFGNGWDISGAYSNVQYIPGVGSSFHDTAIFNTGGLVLHWKPSVVWDFATGYSYTRATRANGITSSAQYQQVNLSEYYSLSKRTGLYALQAFQRTNGNTLGNAGAGHVISATATIGDGFQSAPSSSRSQFAAGVGIVHRF
ncbi:Outer membrane protein (porin) [Paraburkholderia fungorum]|uniref:Outer membrane protein (Porin) n=1 Tax=Paraburkholderia fungorum TaxID=134537 RepID=A0A1H1HC17_9BURK|nr:porin [Paraburkholderia fungorum]SDR22923.1 Outer membrane protein (porin) [Paraburkholderia fungorum]